uniref:Tetratricopeptide repeat protein 8 n=1 Tax=Trichuris muris TaxID=70415 RepID=A0A5S6R415_TRIMR
MDNLYVALYHYRQRNFDKSVEECSKALEANPYDQAAWCLKLNCLVREVKLDDIDLEETGIAEELLNEEVLSGMPRPETSLRRTTSSSSGTTSQSIRPRTRAGRPVTGVLRPESQMSKSDTLQAALRTGRSVQTARPLTSVTGRFIRLGTASMLATEGAFINVSRLNLPKYASRQEFSRPLFEYLYFNLNDVRTALQLALLAESTNQSDWYWKLQVGRCYSRIGQYRDAEKSIKSAYVQQPSITTVLHLSKVYCAIDQPLKAIEVLKQALNKFNEDTALLKALCIIYEKLNNQVEIDSLLRRILRQDSIDIEAIASVATNYFYNDLPELAMRFFRRILQMGVVTTEVYLNIGLCCFNAQQFDLAVDCLRQAVQMATDEQSGDVWYNIGYIALATGDLQWAKQCFSLCLTYSGDYAEAWCNLAVIEIREGSDSQANSLLETAMIHGGHTFEPFYNYALLQYKAGNFQSSLNAVKKSLDIYPEHTASKELFKLLSNLLIRL